MLDATTLAEMHNKDDKELIGNKVELDTVLNGLRKAQKSDHYYK